MSEVPLGSPAYDIDDVHALGAHPMRSPVSDRVGWFWGVGARALVGEITVECALLRAVQRSEQEASQGNSGRRRAGAQESRSQAAQIGQHLGMESFAPELTFGHGDRWLRGQDVLRLGDEFTGRHRDELGCRDGRCHGTYVHAHGPQTKQARGEVGRAASAERIEYFVAALSVRRQHREGKVQGEHREIRAKSVEC